MQGAGQFMLVFLCRKGCWEVFRLTALRLGTENLFMVYASRLEEGIRKDRDSNRRALACLRGS